MAVPKKTVLIIDDHPLFREGLKSLLISQSGFEVIGEAGTGLEGIRKAEKLKPDLVIMDLSLPDQSGIDVTREIRRCLSGTRIMMLSMHSKMDYITESFKAGASGYVVKESASEKLVDCLNTISKGEYFIDTNLSHQLVKSLVQSDNKDAKIKDPDYATLTPREQQILRLVAEGFSNKEIAEKLFISPKTVENHRTSIMSKLDLHSTIELVRYAARVGIIDIELWKG